MPLCDIEVCLASTVLYWNAVHGARAALFQPVVYIIKRRKHMQSPVLSSEYAVTCG